MDLVLGSKPTEISLGSKPLEHRVGRKLRGTVHDQTGIAYHTKPPKAQTAIRGAIASQMASTTKHNPNLQAITARDHVQQYGTVT